MSATALARVLEVLRGPAVDAGPKTSSIIPRYRRAVEETDELRQKVSTPHPSSNEEARKAVLKHVPSFVFYSNYGNLDSEIYLPHVIQNMERAEEDLGARESAKRRTLKVLFDFVKLEPKEILELGQETPPGREPTLAEIDATNRCRTALV